jgi:transcriptional regulator with XRE-family HTH domain
MSDAAELGAFLKARRAALDPTDLGLPPGITQRRVKGLRREELSQLAGISVDYYTRLEQGRATQRVRPELQLLLDAIQAPAFVFGRYLDVLAWNALGGAVAFAYADLGERNIPKLFFLNERLSRELHPEWDAVAGEVVANLRAESGRHPGDPRLAQLVGELSLGSETFRKLWAAHTVREKAHCWKAMRNPIVGDLRLRYETLRLPDDPDQGIVIYHAEPGSDSERALGLLASWIADAPAGDRPVTETQSEFSG